MSKTDSTLVQFHETATLGGLDSGLTMKRLSCLLAFLFFHVTLAAAQTAVVTHNVNIRPDASTSGTPLAKLTVGAQVELLEPNQTNGFFHVKTMDGMEGWAWGKNLKVQTTAPVGLPTDWDENHPGIGISNVRTRLQSLYGNAFELNMRNQAPGGVEVLVSVPFRGT